ncbi:MAG: hypothetical protein HYX94_06305 [Chloroflexi bacterium]|nr:hypothetical protein [Chloroflexota bacterium]
MVRRQKLVFATVILAAALLLLPASVATFPSPGAVRGPTGDSISSLPSEDDGAAEPARARFLKPGPSQVAVGSLANGDQLQVVSKITHSFISWRPEDLPSIENAARKATENGQVAMISWEPRLAERPDPSSTGPDRLVLQRIADGELDDYIRDAARVLKGSSQPIILRFAHEMDLPFDNYHGWYGLAPDVYIVAFRHVHDIFAEEQVDNVIWLWSPGGRLDDNGKLTSLAWYPGNDYVDMVGLSVFVYWRWEEIVSPSRQPAHSFRSPQEAIEPAYRDLALLNKPIILAEVGADLHPSRKGERARWLLSLLDLVKQPSFDKIVAVVFFNAPHPVDNYSADWRLGPDEMNAVINAMKGDALFDAGPRQDSGNTP